MYEKLERLSIKKKDWVTHPKISSVKIYGKTYACPEHEIKNANRGSMKQHIEGGAHRIDFITGQPLKQLKRLPPLPQTSLDYDEDDEGGTTLPRGEFEKSVNLAVLPIKHRVIEKSESYRPPSFDFDSDPWLRKKAKNWQKIQTMREMGMPKHIIQEYMESFGFKKDEDAYKTASESGNRVDATKLAETMVLRIIKIMNTTLDILVKSDPEMAGFLQTEIGQIKAYLKDYAGHAALE